MIFLNHQQRLNVLQECNSLVFNTSRHSRATDAEPVATVDY